MDIQWTAVRAACRSVVRLPGVHTDGSSNDVTGRLAMDCLARLVLLGGLVFLTGCPTANQEGDSTVASLIVEGINTKSTEARNPANADEAVKRVLELVNQERTSRGLAAVVLNPTLVKMAEEYARDLVEERFFAHISPTGEGPAERAMKAGYVFLAIGENLAGGQSSPEQVVREWMNSTQGHRENILMTQWRETGIAVRTGGEYGVYWVQVFANPP